VLERAIFNNLEPFKEGWGFFLRGTINKKKGIPKNILKIPW